MTESEDETAVAEPDGPGGEDRYGPEGERAAARLDDLPDGSGCAEIWSYLSDRRRRDRADRCQSD